MRNYLAIADTYAKQVLDGSIVAGEYIKLAAKRYIADKQRTDWDWHLSADYATKACAFVEALPHVKGVKASRGELLVLDAWQVFAMVNMFGWVDGHGLRRYQKCYIEVAKKNGKSTWIAAVCLYMATADGEAGPEIYTAATNLDQAKIVWNDACAMLRRTPALIQRYGAKATVYDVKFTANNGLMRPLASDKAGSKDGANVHLGVLDEIHAHRTNDTYDIVADGVVGRNNAMIIGITTAGENQQGVAYRERSHLDKVLTGAANDERYFGLIFCLDKADKWQDQANWAKANPGLGSSVDINNLISSFNKLSTTPSLEPRFRQKHLNEWVRSASQWISGAKWQAAGITGLLKSDIEPMLKFGGADIASKLDLMGLAELYAVDQDDGRRHWYLFAHGYHNEAAVASHSQKMRDADSSKARQVANMHYLQWQRDGWLTVNDGNVTDQRILQADVEQSNADMPFERFGYDNHNATMLASNLMDADVAMVDVPMRVNPLSEACKWLELLLADGRLHHDNNPLLQWCIENVVVKQDANENIYPRKAEGQESNKIDLAIAAIVAASQAMLFDEHGSAGDDASGQMDKFLSNPIVVRRR